MTETLAQRIARHEGDVPRIYPDQFGNATGGRGHKLTPADLLRYGLGDAIDQAQDDAWFAGDIEGATAHVAGALPWAAGLDAVRRGVLIEMAFQLGIGVAGSGKGLCGFPNLLAACAAGEHEEALGAGLAMLAAAEAADFDEAAEQMLLSAWHKQTPQRCEELAAIMRTGEA